VGGKESKGENIMILVLYFFTIFIGITLLGFILERLLMGLLPHYKVTLNLPTDDMREDCIQIERISFEEYTELRNKLILESKHTHKCNVFFKDDCFILFIQALNKKHVIHRVIWDIGLWDIYTQYKTLLRIKSSLKNEVKK